METCGLSLIVYQCDVVVANPEGKTEATRCADTYGQKRARKFRESTKSA